jgi:hypothetical protein
MTNVKKVWRLDNVTLTLYIPHHKIPVYREVIQRELPDAIELGHYRESEPVKTYRERAEQIKKWKSGAYNK